MRLATLRSSLNSNTDTTSQLKKNCNDFYGRVQIHSNLTQRVKNCQTSAELTFKPGVNVRAIIAVRPKLTLFVIKNSQNDKI